MIISSPTAFYESVLPGPVGPGNITFTISSNNPPRPQIYPFPLQVSDSIRHLPPRTNTPEERLVALGDFVFSISAGSESQVSIGIKAFEVGQILDFEEEEIPDINQLNVPEVIELQQNTNRLDYVLAGLSENEINSLTSSARDKFNMVILDINSIKTLIADIEIGISDNQRSLNETRKIRDAAKVVGNKDIFNKMTTRETDLINSRDQLIILMNEQTILAESRYNELLELKEVVR